MENDQYLVSVILGGAGAVLSALFRYFPKLREWFAGLSSTKKKLIMIGLSALVTVVVFGAACAQVWTGTTCDQQGAIKMVSAFFMVLIGNQLAYLTLPEPESVVKAKEARE